MITVHAVYRADPAAADAVAAALRSYIPLVRAEPGCETFLVHRATDDPAVFVLYEQYRDEEAFDAHVGSEHYAAIAREEIRPLLVEREVTFLQLLGPTP